jgi:beta-barrel assembly-enhancing protease
VARGASTHLNRPRPAAAATLRTGWLRWIVLAATLAGLTACVSDEQEQRLGDAIATDINRQIPLVRDPTVLLYLNQLGLRIAQNSERPDVPYRFYVINSAVVNAFALPGGHIYVTRGLIMRTENAAELSAVLAHEIGHVAARHGAQALERELRTGSVISMMWELFFRREPALLDQRALQIGGRVWFATHSRRAEREADRLAVQYLIRTGLNPEGMLSMLRSLLEEESAEPGVNTVEWFSTHPTTEERLDLLSRKVERLGPEIPPDLEEDLDGYSGFLRRVGMLPPPVDLFHP